MSFEALRERMHKKLSHAGGLSGRFKFDFGDDGVIFVDTTQSPPVFNEDGDSESDVTFKTSVATFSQILDGTQDPSMAFMMGKLKVKGSMGLAMKLNSFLED